MTLFVQSQARTLKWVAISFSNAWKWKVKVKLLSCVWLFASWTAAYQAPPSLGFSRQEYWSGVPLPSPYLVTGAAWLSRYMHTGPFNLDFSKFLSSGHLWTIPALSIWSHSLLGVIPSVISPYLDESQTHIFSPDLASSLHRFSSTCCQDLSTWILPSIAKAGVFTQIPLGRFSPPFLSCCLHCCSWRLSPATSPRDLPLGSRGCLTVGCLQVP